MISFSQLGNDLYSGKRSYDFIGRRKLWYTIAAILSIISIAALVFKGLTPGIEFSGGTEFRVTGVSTTSETVGEDAVHQVIPNASARVSKLGNDGIRVQADQISDDQLIKVKDALAKAYGVPATQVSSGFVGPSWGADVSRQAIIGLLVFMVLVALVITLYFRTWTMALAAMIALIHDLLITAGVYALVGFEVTPASVIGFLTILGYSLYDTVVVFDKVRENTDNVKNGTKRTFAEAANLAVNQTLIRSINTSVVALLPVASILFIGAFILGAGTLKDIALALFVGIAAGTYSSIFIATPLYVQLRRRDKAIVAHTTKVERRRHDGETEGELAVVGARSDQDSSEPRQGGASTTGQSKSNSQSRQVTRGVSAGTASGGQRIQPKRKGR